MPARCGCIARPASSATAPCITRSSSASTTTTRTRWCSCSEPHAMTTSLQDIASCVAGYDPNALPVAQAQEFIARLVPKVEAVEMLALRSALGRVLARDIVSPIDVPTHDNSAMDGYALR